VSTILGEERLQITPTTPEGETSNPLEKGKSLSPQERKLRHSLTVASRESGSKTSRESMRHTRHMSGETRSMVESAISRVSQLSVQTVTETAPNLLDRGKAVRASLLEMTQKNDFSGIGEAIRNDKGDVLAIAVDPEHMEDFRAVLGISKEEMTKGKNTVILRTPEGYKECQLYLSKDGMAGLAVTKEGAIISVFKVGDPSPREGRHRMVDLMRVAGTVGGGDHLGCLASLVGYYLRFGYEVVGLDPRSPSERNAAWTEQDDKDYAAELKKWVVNTSKGPVALPFVIMRKNPEKFGQFVQNEKMLPKVDFSPSDLDTTHLEGEEEGAITEFHDTLEGYAYVIAMRESAVSEASVAPVAEEAAAQTTEEAATHAKE
jgi:hypothetical protein